MSVIAKASPRTRVIVVATTAIQMVATMSANIMPPIAPIMAASLGVPPALIGAQVSLIYSMAAFSSLLCASALRRLGALFASQLALFIIATGLALSCLPSLWFIAAGALLLGAFYGLPTPAASHLLARFTPPQSRNFIFSIKQTGVPFGIVLSGLIGPSLAQWLGWRAPLVVAMIACIGLALLLAPLRGRLDDDREPAAPFLVMPHVGFKETLSLVSLRRLFAVGMLMAGIQVSVTAFLVIVLVTEYGFDPVSAGFLLAASQAAGVVGRIICGAVADRLGGAGTLMGLAAMSAAVTLALSLVDPSHRVAAVALFVLLGFSASAWTGILIAEAVRLAPADRASEATAVLLFGTFSGVFLGPVVFGVAGSLMGYRHAFAVLAVAAVAAAVTAMLVRSAARS